MKYVFEKYEFSNRGRVFLGYETVNATSTDEARDKAQNKLGDSISLFQIYVPQESQ